MLHVHILTEPFRTCKVNLVKLHPALISPDLLGGLRMSRIFGMGDSNPKKSWLHGKLEAVADYRADRAAKKEADRELQQRRRSTKRICLCVLGVLFTANLLFVPWHSSQSDEYTDEGYSIILMPPSDSSNINFSRVALQSFAILAGGITVLGLASVLLREKND